MDQLSRPAELPQRWDSERCGDPARPERGAAAVEAGIVSLLVFVLFFGIIEFGLLWRNINVTADAAREGAIEVSQLTRDPNFHTEALDRMQLRLDAMPRGDAYRIVIFKADPATAAPLSGQPVETCTTCHNRGKRIGVSYQGLMEAAWASPYTEGGGGQIGLHSMPRW